MTEARINQVMFYIVKDVSDKIMQYTHVIKKLIFLLNIVFKALTTHILFLELLKVIILFISYNAECGQK